MATVHHCRARPDAHTITTAEHAVEEAGLAGRVRLVRSPLEQTCLEEPAAPVVNNTSMHGCRDIDRVTENVAAALEPGGWFVMSDLLSLEIGAVSLTPMHALTYGRRRC